MAFLQVILRNFFSYSILWGDIFLRHMVLWVGFLGASLATREKRHINVDVLSRVLSPAKKRWVYLITSLFSTLVCALLSKAAYVFVADERAAGTTIFLNVPLWLFMSIILVGFVSITFRFLLQSLEAVLPRKPVEEGT
jgi:TRAP-type C4-dicarboxylate transport system permease small subunit